MNHTTSRFGVPISLWTIWIRVKGQESLDKALVHINNTKQLLLAAQSDDSKMLEVTRIELGQGSNIDLPATLYINDFLITNFYFHMVTAYDILRYKGLDISKPDYMLHLASLVKQA
ncbi:DUF1993 family protein [Shewanella algae]|nr:DUF1993 family protein [Shewanella algae]